MADRDALVLNLVAPGEVPSGLDLLVSMGGTADAGGVAAQLNEAVEASGATRTLTEFDMDALVDYREHRPAIVFDGERFGDYDQPHLRLSLAHDQLGAPFLFLEGIEPDLRWDAVTDAIVDLVARFRVRETVWVHSIGLPVPHTRPIRSTVSGNRSDLIRDLSFWQPKAQVPASAVHLLERKLIAHRHVVSGFTILTPHYLSDVVYPPAAVAALERIGIATGLSFATSELREAGVEVNQSLGAQQQTNPEFGKLVHALEARHDEFAHQRPAGELPAGDAPVVSGEQLAAELEQFLAQQHDQDTPPEASA